MDGVLAELSLENLREWQAYFNLEPPARPFALLATILANANRDPEQKPEPWTVDDFLQLLAADPVPAFEDEEEGFDDEFPAEEETTIETDKEPDWMRWKRNFRAYADAMNPSHTPSPIPV